MDVSQIFNGQSLMGLEVGVMLILSGFSLCLASLSLVQNVRKKFFNQQEARRFRSTKKLSLKDYLFLETLQAHVDTTSYCVSDPDLPDNPIVYSSKGFCNMTGYTFEEVEGRNCRFLQGPLTRRADIEKIRNCVGASKACHVEITNYKKNGETFRNSFYMCPLFDDNSKKPAYFVGVQGILGTEELHYVSQIMTSPLNKAKKSL